MIFYGGAICQDSVKLKLEVIVLLKEMQHRNDNNLRLIQHAYYAGESPRSFD